MSRRRRFLFPLVLLAVAVAIAFSAHASEPSKEVRKILPFPAGGRVEIDTYKGSVDLVAEERPDVLVEAPSGPRSARSFGPPAASGPP